MTYSLLHRPGRFDILNLLTPRFGLFLPSTPAVRCTEMGPFTTVEWLIHLTSLGARIEYASFLGPAVSAQNTELTAFLITKCQPHEAISFAVPDPIRPDFLPLLKQVIDFFRVISRRFLVDTALRNGFMEHFDLLCQAGYWKGLPAELFPIPLKMVRFLESKFKFTYSPLFMLYFALAANDKKEAEAALEQGATWEKLLSTSASVRS